MGNYKDFPAIKANGTLFAVFKGLEAKQPTHNDVFELLKERGVSTENAILGYMVNGEFENTLEVY